MSKREAIMVFTLFLFAFFSKAQSTCSIDKVFQKKEIEAGNSNDLYFLCRESVQQDFSSDEFLNDEFLDAQFIDNAEKLFQVKARYNVKRNEMQILFNDKIYILYPHLIQLIEIDKASFSPLMIPTGETQNYVYLKASVIGKMSLYHQIDEKLKRVKSMVYVKKDNGQAIAVKSKKKTILPLFTNQKSKIDRFVIEKDLDYCKLENLERIFTYYNSL